MPRLSCHAETLSAKGNDWTAPLRGAVRHQAGLLASGSFSGQPSREISDSQWLSECPTGATRLNSGLRPRLQRRDRDGIAPSSLFSRPHVEHLMGRRISMAAPTSIAGRSRPLLTRSRMAVSRYSNRSFEQIVKSDRTANREPNSMDRLSLQQPPSSDRMRDSAV